MRHRGKLFGVGVGPGDPELLTLQAVRIMNDANVLAFPKTDEEYNTALDIVKGVVDTSRKEMLALYLPMTRDEDLLDQCHQQATLEIIQMLDQGKNIAFLTLGDPSIYSTYIYLHWRVLKAGYEARLIPGVPSFCAVAAKLNDSLCTGAEPLHIIPASYKDSFGYLDWQGTKVLMKSGKSLGKVIESLRKKDMLEKAAMVERCGMDGETVFHNLTEVNEKTSYFSTIVVKGKGKKA